MVRILEVAELFREKIYNAEFAGKERGRFVIERDQLKHLLGSPRLHDRVLTELTDACLDLGLVLIDMDDVFGIAEAVYVEKWRKLPERLLKEYVNELEQLENDEDEDDSEALDGIE